MSAIERRSCHLTETLGLLVLTKSGSSTRSYRSRSHGSPRLVIYKHLCYFLAIYKLYLEADMPQFTELNVHEYGSGGYHLNRYRRYFTIPANSEHNSISGNLGSHLFNNFPSLFSAVDASVEFNSNHRWRNRNTLVFNGKASLFGLENTLCDIIIPDVHNDWVCVHQQNFPRGFTVQTLRRNFSNSSDLKVGTLTAAATAVRALAAARGTPVPPIPSVAIAVDVNQHHFLAARRSWVVAPASFFGTSGNVEITDNLYAIETAAIARMSGFIVRSVDTTHLMGNLSVVIRRLWTRFVNNYVERMGFEPVDVRLWTVAENGASYIEESHSNRESLEGSSHFSDVTAKFSGIYPRNRVD